jgi:LEA14-like dessication related protein
LDKVRLILTAITIAINVVPIAGVLLMNQNNLLGLVVPPEINTVINDVIVPDGQLGESLGNVTFVDSHYDNASRTVTLTFEVTNPLQFDIAVDSMSADVRCDEHDFPLGHAIINNPVAISAGETATIDVAGTWTQDAIKHFLTAHAGAQKIDVELTRISLTVNGVSIQTDEVMKIPDFPVT